MTINVLLANIGDGKMRCTAWQMRRDDQTADPGANRYLVPIENIPSGFFVNPYPYTIQLGTPNAIVLLSEESDSSRVIGAVDNRLPMSYERANSVRLFKTL